MKKKCLVSWSGGKDSCLAMLKAMRQGYQPVGLLNMMNENGEVSRSHAIPKAVLEAQARAVGLPVFTQPATWGEYEKHYVALLQELKDRYGFGHVVFGDIDLEPHREWEEKVTSAVGTEAVLPLWQKGRKDLVLEMIDEGFEAVIVSCNTQMGEDFLGRTIDRDLIDELEAMGVDACGENGEFHTLVVNAPMFKEAVPVQFGKKLVHEHYCFIEMRL